MLGKTKKGGEFVSQDKSSSLERRKFPRIKDNIFILGNLGSNPREALKAFTKDISAGGLMFENERDISKEMKLELEIYQPMDRDKRVIFSVPVLAKVVWTREIEKENFVEGENRYKTGIEFSEIKEEDRKIIATYVERSISDK